MKRFKLVAYYEDKDTHARVAQSVVVLAEDMKGAVVAIKDTLGPRALNGHIAAVEVKERNNVEAGVVFTGEPYIPLNWPLINRGRPPATGDQGAVAPAEQPREADGEEYLSLDDFIEPI